MAVTGRSKINAPGLFARWTLGPASYEGASGAASEAAASTTRPSIAAIARSHLSLLLGLFGLALLANAFAVYFINQEHYVYWYDFSGFWNIYLKLSKSVIEHPLSALRALIGSIRWDDYNQLPVFALVPFDFLFGSGRLTYILAVTDLYLLPAALIMALAAQRILQISPAERPTLLVLAVASILVIHPLWVPVLRGYPDVVGIVVIGVILLLTFAKPLAEQRMSALVATGALLCLIVLLRRWYLFWAVSFFPALAAANGLDTYQRHGLAWRHYITGARNVVIAGLAFVVTLFGLAAPFALRAVHTDYSDVYSAFRRSSTSLQAAERLVLYFGMPVLLVGLAGLVWLTVCKRTRVAGYFLILQSCIIFALFTRTQDFGAQHYYLLLPSIGVGVAVVAINLFARIADRFWRVYSVGILLLVMLLNSSVVLEPKAASLANGFGRLLPGARHYPLVRNDIDVLDHLLARLDELEHQAQGDVYVLANSRVLNASILQNHCRRTGRPESFCERILNSHDVDKRDGFPRQFLHASYVVLGNPTQYQFRPEDQRVVGVLARDVRGGNGIGASFERVPGEFGLDNDVTAFLYAKVRPFQRTDLDALTEEFAGYYPDRRDMFGTQD